MIKKLFHDHPGLAEITRFVIVGGLATVVDMLMMGVVLYLFQPALYPHFYNVFYGGGNPTTLATVVGTAVGFVTSLIFNYVCSVLFVFQEKGQSRSVRGFVIFAILAVIGLGIHVLGMYLGYDLLHINEWLVKIGLTFIVLVYNYITRKVFIFKKVKKEPVVDEQ